MNGRSVAPVCGQVSAFGWGCALPAGHAGPHEREQANGLYVWLNTGDGTEYNTLRPYGEGPHPEG